MSSGMSGIRKRKTAEETAQDLFQTTNLLISHFKREKDLEEIQHLAKNQSTLNNLLIGSCAVHAYHYLGVRTINALDVQVSVEKTKDVENLEKGELFGEIRDIAADSFTQELHLWKKWLSFEKQILETMSERKEDDPKFIENLKYDLEDEIIEVLNSYPTSAIYNFLGMLVGEVSNVKSEIIDEASGFKAIGVEIDKRLVQDEHKDKCIELSTFNRLVEKLQEKYEFETIQDLKGESFPIRKIITNSINYFLNKYPISIRGLHQALKGNAVKQEFFDKLLQMQSSQVNYLDFEKEMLAFFKDAIKQSAKSGAIPLLYFMENLLGVPQRTILDIFNRFGIQDINLFVELFQEKYTDVLEILDTVNISRVDLIKLNKANNIFLQLENELNLMKRANLCVTKKSFEELILAERPHEKEYVKDACARLNLDYEEVINFYNKSVIVDTVLAQHFNSDRIYNLIFLTDLDEALKNLARLIYFSLFSKACVQMARILEVYIKINGDNSILLLGLKKVNEMREKEKWVQIKIEELILSRIMNRQEELATIFNARRRPFYVNGFILARLTESSLTQTIEELKTQPSFCYGDVVDLPLPGHLVSPVSYALAYEVYKRFELNREIDQLKVEEIVETKKEERAKKDAAVKKAKEEKTLDWIEKRIVGSMRRVTSKGINPTSLYWDKEKDTKIGVSTCVLHSELSGQKICPECGEPCLNGVCKGHPDATPRDADIIDLFAQYFAFAVNKIKEQAQMPPIPFPKIHQNTVKIMNPILEKRLGRAPTPEDIAKMIPGERLDIARAIIEKVAKMLDKALYKKFKANMVR